MKVLLTGGSGFIAAHILYSLLEHGHKVVTTVRSHDKGQKILEAYALPLELLSYVVVSDIAADNAFDKAVLADPPFDAVIHTASPFYYGHADPVKEILNPAIIGTTGILKAIKNFAPSVRRVAITSSFAAMMNAEAEPSVYSENSWNPVTNEQSLLPAYTYRASKTFAERSAWEFVAKENPSFTLTTFCPPLVLGPILGHTFKSTDAINTSNSRIRDMILGKYRTELPPSGVYLWVDVRDLALAHVRGIEVPEAGGERFFVTAGHYSNKLIVEAIRETHPELIANLVPKNSPDDLPSNVYWFDNTKVVTILGLKFRTLNETVSETVESLQKAGVGNNQ